MYRLLFLIVLSSIPSFAQTVPVITGQITSLPLPLYAAPGQILTLLVDGITNVPAQIVHAPAGAALPTSLGGISVNMWQALDHTVPLLEVRPSYPSYGCGKLYICRLLTAVTIQIPYEIQGICPGCPVTLNPPTIPSGLLTVSDGGGGTPTEMIVTPFADQVHIWNSCDMLMSSAIDRPLVATGLPCPAIVTHADGSLVSAASPANGGEELIAYATGLGQTSPPSVTGQTVTVSAPTAATFSIDFNYRPNALATKPIPGAVPLYTGTTPGYVGLYQINFRVPPVPAGTFACTGVGTLLPPQPSAVASNLTVSVGGGFSFDGAGICVAVPVP